MTIDQISAVIACAAAVVAMLGALMSYRGRRTVERTLPIRDGDGVITFPHRMSDAEVEEFKARWQAAHGKPGTPPRGPAGASSANHGPVADGDVCPAYQLPATAEMAGLCARCGMYDYKHQEATGA